MTKLIGEGKPFHSMLDKAAGLLTRKVGTGAEFLKELQKIGGVKKAEIEDRKLGELMGMPKMTHEQFISELAKRPPAQIEEKTLGNPTMEHLDLVIEKLADEDARELAKTEFYRHHSYDPSEGSEPYFYFIEKMRDELIEQNYDEYLERAEYAIADNKIKGLPQTAAHEGYTVPGGENYREMLIKAPKGEEQFLGIRQHFHGEPGILASMRLKDRTGPNGEKLLHLEELQSDWHKQGRKKGYTSNASEDDVRKAYNAKSHNAVPFDELLPEDKKYEIEQYRNSGVADAPFKKNWEEMALKRLVHHAAEKGYHGIVVTPGAEQADRYSLAKYIDSIMLVPNPYPNNKTHPYYFKAFDKQGNRVADDIVNEEKLREYIGKEPAQKLLSSEPNPLGERMISGANIVSGGEGMKGFYDKKVPNILNDIGKKHGVKTQLHSHVIHGRGRERTPEEFHEATRGVPFERHREFDYMPKAIPLHHFPITEEMRKDVLTNGLPLYSGGGEVDAEEVFMGKGGKVKELEQYLRDREGDYGVKRLQRAADEIPGLENMYTLQALKEAFGGDNAKALMTMNPADFEKFASPLIQKSKTCFSPNQTSIDKHSLPTDEYIQHLARIKGFNDVPFLSANKEEQGLPLLPYITGHEGRHRSRALAKMGNTKNLVRLLPSSELREPFPRKSREEYIQALKNELAMTKNMIMPESYRTSQSDSKIKRPAIELPEIYKDGGNVDAESIFFPNTKE